MPNLQARNPAPDLSRVTEGTARGATQSQHRLYSTLNIHSYTLPKIPRD